MPAVTDLEVTFLCNIKTQLVKFILSSRLLKLGWVTSRFLSSTVFLSYLASVTFCC